MVGIIAKVSLVLLATLVGWLVASNLKYHNKYSDAVDDGLKQLLAVDWLGCIILFIYLIYKLVTM